MTDVHWKALEREQLKLNMDASLVHGASLFAVGWVLRDRVGVFQGGRVMRFNIEVYVFDFYVRCIFSIKSGHKFCNNIRPLPFCFYKINPVLIYIFFNSWLLPISYIINCCITSFLNFSIHI